MYWFIAFLPCAALLFSFNKFKSIFHPHFLYSAIIAIMFFSDFIVRGYDDDSLEYIELVEVYTYQAILVAIFATIYAITYFGSSRKNLTRINPLLAELNSNSNLYLTLALFAIIILALEITKRLYYSGWSFELMLEDSFGSRHNRTWDSSAGDIGDGKYLTSFLGIIFPLSGIMFGLLIILARRVLACLSLIGFLIVVTFLIGNGSRTMVILIVAVPLVLFIAKKGRLAFKLPVVVSSLVGLAIVSSLMVQTRDMGIYNESLSEKSVQYSQDDSYYRAIYAMHIAETSKERWDPIPFVGASLLNMIPRALWPEKPTVTHEYWGSYKEFYITITFVGEAVALLGLYGGAIASVLIGLILYMLLTFFYKKIDDPLSLVAYGLCAMYVYMIMRSMLNITQFVYILFIFQAILWMFKRKKLIKRHQIFQIH